MILVDNSDEGCKWARYAKEHVTGLYEHPQGKYTEGYKASGPHVPINRTACRNSLWPCVPTHIPTFQARHSPMRFRQCADLRSGDQRTRTRPTSLNYPAKAKTYPFTKLLCRFTSCSARSLAKSDDAHSFIHPSIRSFGNPRRTCIIQKSC